MDMKKQVITDDYAIYNGDCCEVMDSFDENSIDFSIYSPPFCGLYHYSSDNRDLSNCSDYKEFFEHYSFVVDQIFRLTKPGRLTAVHCCDIVLGGANLGGGLIDFSGDIIKLHKDRGFEYTARYCIWKEPLKVRNRTMAKSLAHKQIVEDSSFCNNASADYLLVFRKTGDNKEPITHEHGLTYYAGEREVPEELEQFKGYTGNQIKNRYSHFIWRQYASAFWDDIRVDNVVKFKKSRDEDDERHVHPLQLDVIERCCELWSNPGDVVLTPFMGVGSEVFKAVMIGRKGIGIELKPSYFKQAIKNMKTVSSEKRKLNTDVEDGGLFS